MQGIELRAARKQLNMTQAELGAALGLSQWSVNQMENGNRPIETRTILALCAVAMGVRGVEDVPALALLSAST